ncbi:MAG: EAL domain-containing protein [Paracoccaceae bacterium]
MKTDPEQTAHLSAFQELIARDVPRRLFEVSNDALIVADLDSRRLVCLNPAALDLLGLTMREVRQYRLDDLVPMAGAPRIARLIRLFARSRRHSLRLSLQRQLFLPFGADVVAYRIDGVRSTLALVVQDTRKKVAALDKAASAEETLRSAIDALPDGFALFDAQDRLTVCNERYRDFYRISAPAIRPGATFEEILRYGLKHGQYAAAHGREEAWLAERLAAHCSGDHTIEQQLDDGRWLRIYEHSTASGGRVGLRIDITDLKRQKERLRQTLRTDELTGLLNRRGLRDDLERLCTSTTKPSDGPVVLYINLRGFRLINDVHGTDIADQILKSVANGLRTYGRQDDLLARIGADEFVVTLVGRGAGFDALQAARDVIAFIKRQGTLRGRLLNLSSNIGVVSCGEAGAGSDILTAAGLAMNAAKALGRDEACLYHSDMHIRAMRENEMALEVQEGIAKGQVLPHFQPQIDIATGRVIGFEALVRWHHPDRGLVPAAQFLGVAQGAGLTEAIDELMMRQSCAAARQLLDWGKADTCISINVSAPQISDPDIVNRLSRHLSRFKLDPRQIRIELLESTLLDDRTSQILQNVRNLIRAGFAIELDDFGTGHAAIATLRQFAVSRIKIDRSLVQHIDSDTELQLITSALINLASRLGINALAEGVETLKEQELLQRIGCNSAQGYLHAKPMPLYDLRAFLVARGELPSAAAEACRQS